MKFIKKNPEPIEFTLWKQQEQLDERLQTKLKLVKTDEEKRKIIKSHWGNLKGREKPEKMDESLAYYSIDELWDALLLEQGHLCAYCGKRLKLSDRANSQLPNDERISGKIEHIEGESINPHLIFEYTNLVAVCDGKQYGDGKRNFHCDTLKEDEILHESLHPTQLENKDLYALFLYSSGDGEMTTEVDIVNNQLNNFLGLNVDLLKERRLDIIKNLSNAFINEIRKARPDDDTFLKKAIEQRIKNIFSEMILDEYCFVEASYWFSHSPK